MFSAFKNLNVLCFYLYLAGGHGRVYHGVRARPNYTADRYAVFHFKFIGYIQELLGRVHIYYYLGYPIAIANVDECDATMIAFAMDPSIEHYSLSDLSGAKLATSDRLYRRIDMGNTDHI